MDTRAADVSEDGSAAASPSIAWRWDPAAGRLHLTGAIEALGLQPLARDGRLDMLQALATSDTGRRARAALAQGGEAGRAVAFTVELQAGARLAWRGVHGPSGLAAGLAWRLGPDEAPEGRTVDPLTGLADRATFLRALQRELDAGRPQQVVVADIVRFRRLNVALGAARADEVLAALGARLLGAAPQARTPARIGDDEFALFAPADDLAARDGLKALLQSPLRLHGVDIHPRVSLGTAGSLVGESAGDLLGRATPSPPFEVASDGAQPPARAALSSLALEADVREGLPRGDFTAFYQPIVSLADGRVAGFEALARWRHPRLGLLHPEEFLPLIQEAGRMTELALNMIEESAAQLARWRRDHAAAGPLTVGVNVTCTDLEHPTFVERVVAALHRHGLPAGALKLELTEGEIMRDVDRAADVLEALRQAGVTVAVDDFGMGFSSLSYLARLPLEQLKIDRYFVKTMAVNEGSAKIVRSVVGLGRDLGLEIIAEGVEDGPMAAELAALGCHYGQGFGYSRPLPAGDAEVYLNESYLDRAPLRGEG